MFAVADVMLRVALILPPTLFDAMFVRYYAADIDASLRFCHAFVDIMAKRVDMLCAAS